MRMQLKDFSSGRSHGDQPHGKAAYASQVNRRQPLHMLHGSTGANINVLLSQQALALHKC